MKINNDLRQLHFVLASIYLIGLTVVFLPLIAKQEVRVHIFLSIPLLFFITIMVLHFKAYIEVKKGTKFGRILSRILGVILLFGFPIGTILGWWMLSQTSEENWQTSDALNCETSNT